MSRAVASERGAISTFLAVIALALLMAAGLAIDGGRNRDLIPHLLPEHTHEYYDDITP